MISFFSPRYRTRQLLNKRWIAEFKKWPWSRWKTINDEGNLNSTYIFSDGDQQGESDAWYTSCEKALEAFSWLGFVDPDLIDEGWELFPEEAEIPVANLSPEAERILKNLTPGSPCENQTVHPEQYRGFGKF